MPLTLNDSTIRQQLQADIQAAWSVRRVYDDPPQTPASLSRLPMAYLLLGDLEPQRSARGASAKEVTVPHLYTMTGQFAWPASGTIEAAKLARAQALLDRLTAAERYAGWHRDVTAIRFYLEGLSANQERYFEIEIEFAVEVITNA